MARQPEVQERIDVEFVPLHVPAVCLAVEAARRDTGVQVGRMRRADLQDVVDVETEQELDPVVVRDEHVAGLPQLFPRPDVPVVGLGKGAAA
jgi:hypothetical protein